MNRILIAEDEPLVHDLVRSILDPARHDLTSVSDGIEAVEHLERETFDLVLLDIGLPRMDGFGVLDRLKILAPETKVVIMTGDATPANLVRSLRERACQLLKKPFAPDALREAVANALASSFENETIEVLSARPEWVELLVPCHIRAAERVQGFLIQLKADLPADVLQNVGLAFHELLVNAIEWGGKFDPSRKVRIAYVRGKKMLMYRIADPGSGFNMRELTHAAAGGHSTQPHGHLEARAQKGLRPGGFGIAMVQAMVDELIYNEPQNEVLFVKYLSS
ncbi:MAG: response regulator [Terriglobia bacterium]